MIFHHYINICLREDMWCPGDFVALPDTTYLLFIDKCCVKWMLLIHNEI